jgi:hypothetical protein
MVFRLPSTLYLCGCTDNTTGHTHGNRKQHITNLDHGFDHSYKHSVGLPSQVTSISHLISSRTSTTLVICPTPSPGQTCKFSSSRNRDWKYLLKSYTEDRSLDGITKEQCHQVCLKTPECKAWGTTLYWSGASEIDLRTACALYRVPVTPDIYVQPFQLDYIYDRGCADYLPVSSILLSREIHAEN